MTRIRIACSASRPDPELIRRSARYADMAHNIPQWLVGNGIPRGMSLFDLLEEFAISTNCEAIVARELDDAGCHERAARLRKHVAG